MNPLLANFAPARPVIRHDRVELTELANGTVEAVCVGGCWVGRFESAEDALRAFWNHDN